METNIVNPVYIVTGATDNMGSVITRRLASQGKAVVLACRDVEKARQFAEEVSKQTRNKDLTALQLDLSSFAQVKDFVERLKALHRPIAALINNAGTLPRHSKISPDGYEHAIQVNFLSTVLLSMMVRCLCLSVSFMCLSFIQELLLCVGFTMSNPHLSQC